ncbi:hypothetical protein [Thermosynechococcus sp.]|uniref:hypothetical protein n=1 Tax=Thermosynechococcus sp. TaxID=2814275 RepID=UPI00391CA2FE
MHDTKGDRLFGDTKNNTGGFRSDVDEHLEQIAKLRRLAHQYRGTKLLGAVAEIIVPCIIWSAF